MRLPETCTTSKHSAASSDASESHTGNLQDCSFHPTESLLAAGIITGQVRISEYSESGATRKSQKRLHSESCRAVQFSALGDALLSGSADKSVVLLDTGTCKVQRTQQNAHPAGISRLAVLSETSFVSGTGTLLLVLHNPLVSHM